MSDDFLPYQESETGAAYIDRLERGITDLLAENKRLRAAVEAEREALAKWHDAQAAENLRQVYWLHSHRSRTDETFPATPTAASGAAGELDRLRAENERLRAALQNIRAALESIRSDSKAADRAWEYALAALEGW